MSATPPPSPSTSLSDHSPVSGRHIAIVGAGFTGSLLAAHLLRSAPGPLVVHLIEAGHPTGAGLAYSTGNSGHLLNVRAYNMSAYPDDPRHFLRWLWGRDDGGAIPPSGHAFVSRGLYGAYVRDVLDEAQRQAPSHARLNLIRGEVVDLRAGARAPAGLPAPWQVRLSDGRTITADTAALCIGHFLPAPPPLSNPGAADALASPRFIGDPWDGAAIAAIPADAPVAILGTGLTMVDTVLSLLDQEIGRASCRERV